MTSREKFLTLQQASEQFAVPIPTLRDWLDRKYLTKWRQGRIIVVDPDELQREVEKRRMPRRED